MQSLQQQAESDALVESVWARHVDPHYYDRVEEAPRGMGSTLAACVDAMVGRGRCGRVRKCGGAQ